MATSDAPLQIGRVALIVNDLDNVGDFYQSALGLAQLSRNGEEAVLGVEGTPLVHLRRDRTARHRPREAGLFHTAFLLPDRQALGRWLGHAAQTRLPLDGASDHLVSEAIYLHDPEGNGIEIYADRPRDRWTINGSEVQMDTIALDLQGLLDAADAPWTGMPAGSTIGHVHLQVGNVAEAEQFYMSQLGFDRSAHIFGASFFGSGGYHHHLAGNIWNSRGAGLRSKDATGLAEVVLDADQSVLDALPRHDLTDPWGTRIRVQAKA